MTTWYVGTTSTNGGSLGFAFSAGVNNYSLTALNGTYNLTGQSVTIARERSLTGSLVRTA